MSIQIHGGDIYRNRNVLDFSVNSNPLGVPKTVVEAVRNKAEEIIHYPDIYCERLTESISRFEGVSEKEIICGNGAAELFFAAVFAVRPKKALLLSPAFSEYERALKAVDAEIRYLALSEERAFEVDDSLLAQIVPELDMMFLCNPNNPTGCVISRELLEDVLEKCRLNRVLLVLDECFIDFLEEPEMYEMKGIRHRYRELFIVKAFTKLFAVPGLRLGYGISGNQQLLHKMQEILQPWNVSALAQEGGAAALTDCGEYCVEKYIKDTRKYVARERKYLTEALGEMGFQMYNSKANYVFFCGEPGLYQKALEAGFLIRDCSGYRGLSPGFYRIAVRRREENERFITWLKGL